MQEWMVSANIENFDYESAFNKLGYVDWRQNVSYCIGDVVYIYCKQPCGRVRYKTFVEEVDLTPDLVQECAKYRRGKTNSYADKYVRLRLTKQVEAEELSLKYLLHNGIKNAPQKPIIVRNELSAYLDSLFRDGADEEDVSESSQDNSRKGTSVDLSDKLESKEDHPQIQESEQEKCMTEYAVEEGATVHHKIFGTGKVIQIANGKIYVAFDEDQKPFQYPEAFKKGWLFL